MRIKEIMVEMAKTILDLVQALQDSGLYMLNGKFSGELVLGISGLFSTLINIYQIA